MSVRILASQELSDIFSIAQDRGLLTLEGAKLWVSIALAENYRAFNYRYSESIAALPIDYEYRKVAGEFFRDLIDGLEYQVEELPDWESTPLYWLLNEFKASI